MNASLVNSVVKDLSTPRDHYICQSCGQPVFRAECMDDFAWGVYKIGAKYCDDCLDASYDVQTTAWQARQRVIDEGERNKLIRKAVTGSGIPEGLAVWDPTKGNNDLRGWVHENRSRSLFIGDTIGACKTRAVCSVAFDVIQRGEELSVRFWRMVDLTLGLSAACGRSMGEALDMVIAARSCGLLILDDMGKEKITDRVGEFIFSIIDYRYARDMATWITSNYSGQEMAKRLGDDRGPAILRRIRETCLSWQRAKASMAPSINNITKGEAA